MLASSAKTTNHLQEGASCLVLVASTLHPSVSGTETSTHLESASALHCGAAVAASLLNQSRSFMAAYIANTNHLQAGASCLVLVASTLHPSVSGKEMSAHLESAFASHRGAAATLRLLDQSRSFMVNSDAKATHLQEGASSLVLLASTLHPSAKDRDEHAP